MTHYNLGDFININNNNNFKLPQETVDIIFKLSEQVSSPSYVRTPVFNKKEFSFKNQVVNRRRRKGDMDNMDWEVLRNFQTTKIEKKEGLDKTLITIRKYLNNITDKTYNEQRDNIIKLLDSLTEESTDKDRDMIRETIYNILSTNSFFSELYALLYKELTDKYDYINVNILECINDFITKLDNLTYHDPAIDYELYCKYNKENDILKSSGLFYVNLMKIGIITETNILDILLQLQEKMNNYIKLEGKREYVENLSENIYIIVKSSHDSLNSMDEYNKIHDNIIFIANSDVDRFPSISHKTIFKHMDIIDIVKLDI